MGVAAMNTEKIDKSKFINTTDESILNLLDTLVDYADNYILDKK